ncbi:MAG: phage major capsid protein [Rhizobiales bacterium]|nr:phage major capsid protein [Hyphomicrobiales bacterium]
MEFDINQHAPEIKAGVPSDPLAMHDETMRAFEEYKATNDARLAAIEKGRGADPLTEEKMARLNARMDELTLKSARPALASEKAAATHQAREHKQAFDVYMRQGESGGLRMLETKALSIGSNPDGGYLVPDEIAQEIGKRLSVISPIRSIAGVQEVSSLVYKKPFMTLGPTVGWVGETASRTQAMELYAMPAATPSLLEDAAVNVDEWLAAQVEQAFAEQEGTAFVTGDGSNKPKGFLSYTNVANGSWEWGKLGYLATGVAGDWPASDPSDILVDLVYAVRAGYRQNAAFAMNRKTQAAIRKFKDSSGNYLWQPPAVAGGRASLMTFPVVEAEDMPDVGANSLSVAFGDFRRGYLIVDRQGVRVLRDPYSAKPYVLFYTTKRVGGGVQDFDAIKLLKFAAS